MDYALPAAGAAGTSVAVATVWYFDAGLLVALSLMAIYAALVYYLVGFDVTLRGLGSPTVDDRRGRLLHHLAFGCIVLTFGWFQRLHGQGNPPISS